MLSARALIAFDADINSFTIYNETPFDLAWRNCRSVAELLIGIGGRSGLDIMSDLQVLGSQMYRVGVGVGALNSDEGANERSIGADGVFIEPGGGFEDTGEGVVFTDGATSGRFTDKDTDGGFTDSDGGTVGRTDVETNSDIVKKDVELSFEPLLDSKIMQMNHTDSEKDDASSPHDGTVASDEGHGGGAYGPGGGAERDYASLSDHDSVDEDKMPEGWFVGITSVVPSLWLHCCLCIILCRR